MLEVLVAQSCLTLCDPLDCSPPGSSVHEILHARILEWVVISFSRGSFPPRDQTQISCIEGSPKVLRGMQWFLFMSILFYPVSFLKTRLYLIHLNTFYYLWVGLVCLWLKCFETVCNQVWRLRSFPFPCALYSFTNKFFRSWNAFFFLPALTWYMVVNPRELTKTTDNINEIMVFKMKSRTFSVEISFRQK